MKQPVDYSAGYTKTQAILVSVTILIGTTFMIASTNAATNFNLSDLSDAPLIGAEAIRAPEESMILLPEDQREDNLAKIREEALTMDTLSTVYMEASAYNSVPGQTDASPYKTAIGSLTRDGVIASNYFPIGTRIRIPDHFGDKVFRVEDRMNPRYHKTLDIWMEEISDAKQWGRRYIKVDVVKWGLGRGVE